MSSQEISENEFCIIPIQEEYIEDIRQWRNSQMDVLRQNSYIEKEDQVMYYENNIWPEMLLKEPNNILFAYLKDEVCVGYGGFVHVDWVNAHAEVSFLIDTKYINDDIVYKDFFSVFIRLLKKAAFRELCLERIFTETYEFRKKHIEILENAGFLLEGRLRKHVKLNDKYFDVLVHGSLVDDEK